jgi:hypothetical protein
MVQALTMLRLGRAVAVSASAGCAVTVPAMCADLYRTNVINLLLAGRPFNRHVQSVCNRSRW